MRCAEQRCPFRCLVLLALAVLPAALAQTIHEHSAMMSDMNMEMPEAFGGIPATREASGTAWQPDATPMHAHHSMWGEWQVMTHYNAFLGYDHQSGDRGDDQFASINWLMLMAARQTANDRLVLRGMFSLEPWTTTARGYPLLFQTGEAYRGQPLVDRQHPHDFFMELAALYRHALANDAALTFYVAPSGEPALGPPGFPHRLSAMDNPVAPISHHWLDSTHISFGVLTVGVSRREWQLEGSWFNGHEPDEHRWNLEDPRLNSWAGRLSWNPTGNWSAQISHGDLESPEELHPGEDVRRTTASVTHVLKLGGASTFAATAGWGRNAGHGRADNAWLLEGEHTGGGLTVFGRAEYVEKSAEEIDFPGDEKFGITQLTLGASHELVRDRPWELALGGSLSYSFAPNRLDRAYGEHPVGYWIFLRLRPAAMEH